jgi:hypothetical protein
MFLIFLAVFLRVCVELMYTRTSFPAHKCMCVGQQFNAKYFLPCQTRRKLIVDVVLQPKRTLLPPDSVIWQTENDKCHCNFFLIPPPLFAIRVMRPCVMKRKYFTSYVPLLVFFCKMEFYCMVFLNVSIAYQP